MLEPFLALDPLTGLPNRRGMDELVARELSRRRKHDLPHLALGLIDVDHLKDINARYMLPAGDKVLADLAKVIARSLRTIDSLGRIGGDRFLVVAPDTNLQEALALGEHIRSGVEEHIFRYKANMIAVRVSIGLAVANQGVITDYDQMKPIAAACLAQAKWSGRNRCCASYCQDPSVRPQLTADDF